MNYSMIFYIIGWILNVEAALMIPSAIVAVIVLCLVLGILLMNRSPRNKVFYAKEGAVTVALSWIIMSLMGALPFVLCISNHLTCRLGHI